jgi:hypothetical protein
MMKFLIVLESPDVYLELDSLNGLSKKLLQYKVYLPKQDWRHTPPMDAMCLPYHGGWVACKTVVKGKNKDKYAGLLYSTDFSLIPPPSKEVKILEEIIAKLNLP